MAAAPEAIEAAFRADYGRVFAMLVRRFGDFAAAEDALQEAFVNAVDAWSRDGIPDRPAAWIATAAKNAATSHLRHASVVREKHEEIARELRDDDAFDANDFPDDRLRLIFTCCHPALPEDARVALTLHTLCGLGVPAIARLFFANDATIAQRLVRAKKKIRTSGIPYVVPSAERLDERLETVLSVVYLLFTEGYAASEGDAVVRTELCEEAIRLARALCHLAPTHAEARGLLALMLLHHARRATRVDDAGEIVALDEQDRSRWDPAEIDEGKKHLDEALARGRPGPYQIQAAIAALHASAKRADATDWPQIAGLYASLLRVRPSPSAALSLAFAEGMARGAEHGLAVLDRLERDGALEGSRQIAATRGELSRRAGKMEQAARCYDEAVDRARTEREKRYLARRAAECRSIARAVPPR